MYNVSALVPQISAVLESSVDASIVIRNRLSFTAKGKIVGATRGKSFATSSLLYTVDISLYSTMRSYLASTVKSLFNSPSASMDLLPMETLVALYVSSVNNMRIEELLSISPEQYIGNNRFVVYGAKRSRSYTIELRVCEVPADMRLLVLRPARVFQTDYKTVWRWCVRASIGNTPTGRKSVARTHAHRYSTARSVSMVTTDQRASDALHHSSARSLSYYLK